LRHEYQKLTDTGKKALTKEINVVQEQHVQVYQANPKAVQHDVNLTFDAMEKEVSAIVNSESYSLTESQTVDICHFMHRC
jgi:hypothetical protein